MSNHKPVTDETLATFLAYLVEQHAEYMASRFPSLPLEEFSVKMGSKNIKIVKGGGVFCFVEKATGKIMKAATWKAPEPKRYERGNVNDPEGWAKWIGPYGPAYLK